MEIILGIFLVIIIMGIMVWKWLTSIDYTIGDFMEHTDSVEVSSNLPWEDDSHTENSFN